MSEEVVQNKLRCSTCGKFDGDIVDDRVTKLGVMRLMQKARIPEDAPRGFGHIVICNQCREKMAFDMDGFLSHIDRQDVNGSKHDTIVFWFLTIFITQAWAAKKPPSFNELAKLMNAAKITTQQGCIWEYHNVRQKCERLGINPKALHTPVDNSLVPAAVLPMLEAINAVLVTHPDFGPEYLNQEWGQLPGDIPGQN